MTPSGETARGAAADTVEEAVTIENRRGLHARASAKFVKTAGDFDADVQVTKDGVTVSGRSIMGLMMLAAARGEQVIIRASGPEAQAALDALSDLVGTKFGED